MEVRNPCLSDPNTVTQPLTESNVALNLSAVSEPSKALDLIGECSSGNPMLKIPKHGGFTLPCTSTTPFAQVPLGDPFTRLRQGQILKPQPEEFPSDIYHERPIPLGSVTLGNFTPNQILFTFGVLAIMGRLSPKYQFKYGGPNGRKIGVRLTLYGHTVVVGPTADSAGMAKVMACSQALAKLRKFNPQWITPPLPMDGQTGPEWNWVRLLEEYCKGEGWGPPLYNPTVAGEQQWHCDISMNGQLFRTVSPCDGLGKAQNTVAHTTLYQLLVSETVSAAVILPADELSIASDVGLRAAVGQQSGTDFEAAGPRELIEGLLRELSGQGEASGPGKRSPRRRQLHSQTQAQSRGQPEVPSKRARRKAANKDAVAKGEGNANRIPLTNSRLAPIVEPMEIAEDPLATLRAIQTKLEKLDSNASYFRILINICDALHVNKPDIRLEKDLSTLNHSDHVVRAWFDDSNPYLSRATPIPLAYLSTTEVDTAHSIGVKKVILFLLTMAKEDAGLESSDRTYTTELPRLRSLELEIEHRLHRV